MKLLSERMLQSSPTYDATRMWSEEVRALEADLDAAHTANRLITERLDRERALRMAAERNLAETETLCNARMSTTHRRAQAAESRATKLAREAATLRVRLQGAIAKIPPGDLWRTPDPAVDAPVCTGGGCAGNGPCCWVWDDPAIVAETARTNAAIPAAALEASDGGARMLDKAFVFEFPFKPPTKATISLPDPETGITPLEGEQHVMRNGKWVLADLETFDGEIGEVLVGDEAKERARSLGFIVDGHSMRIGETVRLRPGDTLVTGGIPVVDDDERSLFEPNLLDHIRTALGCQPGHEIEAIAALVSAKDAYRATNDRLSDLLSRIRLRCEGPDANASYDILGLFHEVEGQ